MPLVSLARLEWLGDISLATTNSLNLATQQNGLVPSDYAAYALFLEWEGRMTNPAAGNPTAVLADAPYSLIERVDIEGRHVVRGNEPFFSMRGAEIRELARIYAASAPFSTPATLSVAASATNDIRFMLPIIFPPEALPLSQQIGWVLDCQNYVNLTVKILYSDDKSVFTGQTTAPTFSAFGSATGSPRVRLYWQRVIGGPQQLRGFVPGRVWRNFVENTTGDIVGTVTASRQFVVPRGNRLRSILVKSGAKSSAPSASNNVYTSLSTTKLTNLILYRGTGKQIRRYNDMLILPDEIRQAFGLAPTSGYGLIDFVQHGKLFEILDLRGAVAGPTGDIDVYLAADITGAAGDGAVYVWQELRGRPQGRI